LLFFSDASHAVVAVSNTGSVAYRTPPADSGQRQLVWVDRSGREEVLGAPSRPYVYPRLSPDGRRVAVDSRDEGLDIWIWDIARRALTPLTFHPALDLSPVWTPDGARIAFASSLAPQTSRRAQRSRSR